MRFFYREMRDRLFVIRKSLKIDFRHELRTHQLTELVGEKPELHGNTGSPSVGNGLGFAVKSFYGSIKRQLSLTSLAFAFVSTFTKLFFHTLHSFKKN